MVEINPLCAQQQNQQSINLMSKLSNVQSQNNQPLLSHRNQPHSTPLAHSEHPNPLDAGRPEKQWVATYIDGQYFLTDPESINKLKHIEAQIEEERNRLAKLQHENASNNSFLSYQEEAQERHSNNSFCDTEFNPSRHFTKQQAVKNDLEKEEELYREKLKNMERQKLQLKKNMKQEQRPPSHKKSQVKHPPEQAKSKKPEEEGKSYHKSRIEKSIKDNIALNGEEVPHSPQKSVKVEHASAHQKSLQVEENKELLQVEGSTKKQAVAASSKNEPASQKAPSAKEASHVSKSIKIVVLEPNGHQLDLEANKEQPQKPQKSVKAEVSPQKSVKQSVKQSAKGQQKSVKPSEKSLIIGNKSQKVEQQIKPQQKSVKAAPSVSAKVSPSVKKDDKSVKASQKSVHLQVKQQVQSAQKSVKNSVVAKSQKPSHQSIQNPPQKSQKSHQQQQNLLVQVQQPKHSQRKSVKKSQKASLHEKAQSQKPQKSIKISEKPAPSVKLVQIPIQSRSEKQPSHISQKEVLVNQSPSKSVRSSIRASSKNKPKEEQSVRSKANEPIIEPRPQSQKQSIKSVPQSHLHVQKQREQQVKSRKSNIIQQIKSKKSQHVQQEIKSKKSHLSQNLSEEVQVKSKKSQQLNLLSPSQPIQTKSIKHEEDAVSRKASSKNEKAPSVKQASVVKEPLKQSQDEIQSKKSVKVQQEPQILSQKSSKYQLLSKKSQQSPQKSQSSKEVVPIKAQQFQKKSTIKNEQSSFSKKQPSPPIQLSSSPPKPTLVDQSIQYSRLTSQHPQQSPSERNSFIMNNNDTSMNQSSKLKLQMLHNELKPEVQDLVPTEHNMKKKKQQPLQNQNEKKSKSFVIHSRQGSVKDRSQKQYERLNSSKISSPSRKSKNQSFNQSSVINQSVTKEEISKLHEQILLLQEKLKKVEDRQEQLQKLQGTISKIQLHQEIPRKEEEKEEESRVKPSTPFIQNLAEVSIAIRTQPRLQIQSSILQVNTTDEIRKKQEKEVEHSEKTKLKDEIGRLKKIIRDMQIEKIKSIDHEGELESPTLKPRNFDGRESREIDRGSRVERQSINSGISSGQRRFGSNNKRLLQDAGKILHNTSYLDRPVQTPKRTSLRKPMKSEDEVASDANELPVSTNSKKVNKFYSEMRKNDMMSKLGDKEKDFHNFIESSRVIAEESGNNKGEVADPVVTPFKNFSRIGVDSGASKINYSRMVQEMKKNNPEEDEVLPQIHMRDIKMPVLPPSPNTNMTQEQLLALAKETYLVFGVNVDEEEKQLCVKKYKNCVIFTLNNQNHECILWHFSGKFYMGGWKSGEPGEGEKDGEGLEYIPDKHVYKGQFLNGKKNGTGILKLSNGNIYDGQWIDGIKNGRGVYLDAATKVVYSGEWRDGKKEGQGFLKLSQKEYYYGTFIKSIKESFGVQVFVNGDKYKGEYKNGKFHGKGKYLWANGSCYEGQFHEGVRHGQGSWKSAKVNGDIYIGTYDNDKKNGYGRYVWANGCMYEGGFSQDVKHGKGRLTYQDGKEIKGVWEEGNLVATENEKPVEHQDQPLRRSVKVTSFGYPSSSKRI